MKASGLWWHFWSSQPKLANAYIQTVFTPEQYSMSAPMYFHHKEKNSCLMNKCIPHFSLLPWFPFFFFLVSTALCPLVICCFPNFQTLRVWLCSKIKSYRGNAVKMSLLGLAQSSMTGIVKKKRKLGCTPQKDGRLYAKETGLRWNCLADTFLHLVLAASRTVRLKFCTLLRKSFGAVGDRGAITQTYSLTIHHWVKAGQKLS